MQEIDKNANNDKMSYFFKILKFWVIIKIFAENSSDNFCKPEVAM